MASITVTGNEPGKLAGTRRDRRWLARAAARDEAPHVPLDVLLEAEQVRRRTSATPAQCREARDLRRAYEVTHGRILDLYVCSHVDAGAILTDWDEIHMRYPADKVAALQPEFEETLWRASAMAREGKQLLAGRRRRLLLERLQSVVVYLLGVLDSQHAGLPATGAEAGEGAPAGADQSAARIAQSLGTAQRELNRTEAYARQSVACRAQQRYLEGMTAGVVALPLLAASLNLVEVEGMEVAPLVITVAAGGVGAIISVMTRITAGRLTLDDRANPFVTYLAGAFRPLIGALLGAAVYVLVKAGLVPLAVPADGTDAHFFAGLALMAGFSERWAQDMLARPPAHLNVEEPASHAPPPEPE